MPSEIKDLFAAATALNITIASMATSSSGVGRQSDMIDNSVTRYQRIRLFVKTTLGTSPVANTGVYVHALRGDKHATPYRSDGAGASDAALTVLNAPEIGTMRVKAVPATSDVLYGDFEIVSPGPEWGVQISHDTGANLNGTAGNHFVHWVGLDPEVQ